MPLLDAVLAFAITILALAMVVTVLVQIVQDLVSLRARGLRRMLERFYAEDLCEVLAEKTDYVLGRAARAAKDKAERFAKELGSNPSVGQIGRAVSGTRFTSMLMTSTLVNLDHSEFRKRLRTSEIGQEIERKLGAQAEAALEHIAARYEVAAAAASELFGRKSRWLSIGLGFTVAFAFNVDGLRLLDTYLNDDAARSQVIAQQEGLLGRYERIVERSEDRSGQAGQAGQGEQAQVTLEEIKAQLGEIDTLVTSLQQPRLPIGWSRFPNCPEESVDSRCVESRIAYRKRQGQSSTAALDHQNAVAPFRFAVANGLLWSWLAGVLTTGLLVGLGAPFWYDVVQGIAGATQRLRKGDAESKTDEQKSIEAPRSTPAPPAAPAPSPTAPAADRTSTPARRARRLLGNANRMPRRSRRQ